jgi:hypothetical protein
MTDLALHTATTAPDASKPLLAKSVAAYGMIPGLHAAMAEAPGCSRPISASTRCSPIPASTRMN